MEVLSLEIQAASHGFQLIISDPQIALGVSQAIVIQLVHDEGNVHALHASMIAPGELFTVIVTLDYLPTS